MKMNKQSQLALNFVSKLNHHPKRVSDISREIHADRQFLEQIARRLRLAGLIHSVRGPGGGYSKDRLISAFEIFTALQGQQELDDSTAGHVQAMVAETLKNTLI